MRSSKTLYEGKAKRIIAGPKKNTLIQIFKDDATAYNKKKHKIFKGKGVLNNVISGFIMEHLKSKKVPTHFLKRINDREQLIKKCEIIPIEFVVRNIATGSLTKRLGIEEGTILDYPLIEYCLKNDDLGDPLVSREHILSFNWMNIMELELINDQCKRINDFLQGMFRGVGIKLVDFKLEFGRSGQDNEIILADEISPDTCRLWDSRTEKKLDKDIFRKDLGNLIEGYQEVAKRLDILHEHSNIRPIKFPKPKAVKIKKK
jgi:phosphoribosylaminoimidazole-succinocarboxamide synthase